MAPTRSARGAAACLALALAGCGGSTNPPAGKTDPGKSDPGKGDQAVAPNTAVSAAAAGGPADDATLKAATDFLKSVTAGSVTPAALAPGFLRAVGKPISFESDKARGYSGDAAVSWLKRVGGELAFGPPSGTAGGGAAVLSGALQGPDVSGRYLLRLVQDGGWKVDWFQISSSKVEPPPAPAGDAAFREFAATAFLDALADKGAVPVTDRHAVVAGLLTPERRKDWAPPFASHAAQGYDYGPPQIDVKLAEIGPVETYTRSPVGSDLTVKGELVRAGAKKPFALKLAKGPAAGQWLVSEFAVN
jgi:hypothetical protein